MELIGVRSFRDICGRMSHNGTKERSGCLGTERLFQERESAVEFAESFVEESLRKSHCS